MRMNKMGQETKTGQSLTAYTGGVQGGRAKKVALRLSAQLACVSVLALGAAVTAPQAYAQEASSNEIRGEVRNEDGAALAGIEVEVVETGRRTFTDEAGRFVLRGVASGSYQIVARSTNGASQTISATTGSVANFVLESSSVSEGQIIVSGERAGGLNIERSSLAKISVISGEEAGRLPDENVAESIDNLTGVSIDQDRGEGRFVSIRGLGPAFNAVKLNGVSIGSPESNGLSVPLDIFPSSIVSTIQVSKALTPKNDAASIGGEINIRTPSVFGRDRINTVIEARGGWNDLGNGERLAVSGNTGFIFGSQDQFGVTLTGEWSRRDLLAETIEISDFDTSDDVVGFEGEDINVPDDIEYRDQRVFRERITIGGVLEYKPNDTDRIFVQGTFSRFEEDELRNRRIIQLDDDSDDPIGEIIGDAPAEVDTIVLPDGSSIDAVNDRSLVRGLFPNADDSDLNVQRDFTPQEFLILTAGGEFEFSSDFKGEFTLGYSRTTENRLRERLSFENQGNFTLQFDASETPLTPALTALPGDDDPALFNDPSSFRLENVDVRFDPRRDEIYTLASDFTYFADLGGNPFTVDFGARATLADRKIFDQEIEFQPLDNDPDFLLSDALFGPLGSNDDFFDGLATFGPRITRDALEALFPGGASLDLAADLADNGVQDSPSPLDQFVFQEFINGIETRSLEENVFAGYVQGTWELGDLTLLGGVRVEHTSIEVDFNPIVEIVVVDTNGDELVEFVGSGPNVVESNSYTDFFPSLHARYDWGDTAIVRASVSRSTRRPSFNALAFPPEVVIEQNDESGADRFLEVDNANPFLDPVLSWNFDASIDFSLGEAGNLGFAVFYKDISNLTVGDQVLTFTDAADVVQFVPEDQPDTAALLNGSFETEEFISRSNSNGEVKGIEINYSNKFTFLPSPLDGLGFDGNISFFDSEQTTPIIRDGETIGSLVTNLEDQVDMTATAILTYEKGPLDIRVSYAYIGDRLDDSFDGADSAFAFENETLLARERLGARVGYRLLDGFEIFWRGNHFTSDNLNTTRALTPNMLRENERNRWWMEFGARAKF
ncbi:MAG: TonB-dependent receptor [Pseudomonadota bacterium]